MENLLFSAKGDKKWFIFNIEVLNVLWLPQNTHMNFIKVFHKAILQKYQMLTDGISAYLRSRSGISLSHRTL